jgi:hypothetical protein
VLTASIIRAMSKLLRARLWVGHFYCWLPGPRQILTSFRTAPAEVMPWLTGPLTFNRFLARGFLVAFMLETVQTSETSVNSYQSTWRYNPEDSHLLYKYFSSKQTEVLTAGLVIFDVVPCNVMFESAVELFNPYCSLFTSVRLQKADTRKAGGRTVRH